MYFKSLIPLLDKTTILGITDPGSLTRCRRTYYVPEGDIPSEMAEEDTVFFCSARVLRAYAAEGSVPAAFVVFPEAGDPENALPPAFSSILVRDRDALRDAYERISGTMARLQRMRDKIDALFPLVSQNVGLQSIVNRLDGIFGCCVSVLDMSFMCLAYSDVTPVKSPVIMNDMETMTLPDEITRRLLFADQSGVTDGTRMFDNDLGDGFKVRNYLTPIISGGLRIGSFSLLYIREPWEAFPALSEEEMLLLRDAAAVLALELSRDDFSFRNKSAYYSNLMSQLISDPESRSEEEFLHRFALLGYNMGAMRQIACADLTGIPLSPADVQTLARRIRGILPGSVYALYEQSIIFLISSDTLPCIHEERRKMLDEYLTGSHIQVGISPVFTQLRSIPESITLARAAVTTGSHYQPSDHVFSFDTFRIRDLIRRAASRLDLRAYCYPPFTALLQEDRRRGTKLAETLLLYLENDRDVDRTCRALFIHRNTLYYRLGRIRDDWHIPFDSPAAAGEVLLTRAILRYYGEPE